MGETAERDEPRGVWRGIEFTCPECGELLILSIPGDGGPVTVVRRRDIASEDTDEDDEGEGDEGEGSD